MTAVHPIGAITVEGVEFAWPSESSLTQKSDIGGD